MYEAPAHHLRHTKLPHDLPSLFHFTNTGIRQFRSRALHSLVGKVQRDDCDSYGLVLEEVGVGPIESVAKACWWSPRRDALGVRCTSR